MSVARLAIILILGLGASIATAQSLDSLLRVVENTHDEAAASQQRIDALADSTRLLLSEYREELQQAESLRIYNEQLEQLIASQRSEIETTREEMQNVAEVEREIMPLMGRMIDTLDRFVEEDAPFLLEERRGRVAELRGLLLRSDVTVAEKYRRLMEAWQVETDFGHTIEAYTAELDVDGTPRTVDFLRIGRVALFYQTLDGERSGAWNGSAFVPIDADYNAAVKNGLRIARRQAPPGMLLLPLSQGPSDGGR